jgi:hypothetical protein
MSVTRVTGEVQGYKQHNSHKDDYKRRDYKDDYKRRSSKSRDNKCHY